MLHHISFAVTDIERAAKFYDQTLSALGYVRVFEDLCPGEQGQAVGYGLEGQGDKSCIKQANYYACFVVDPDGQRIEAVINAVANKLAVTDTQQ